MVPNKYFIKDRFCLIIYNKKLLYKVCISAELANLIYDKVEKNQALGIKTIKHKLCRPEVKDLQVEE